MAHPEQQDKEYFLGNFTWEDSKLIPWKTKRAGTVAYMSNGSLYPYQETYTVLPYFVNKLELIKAGIALENP